MSAHREIASLHRFVHTCFSMSSIVSGGKVFCLAFSISLLLAGPTYATDPVVVDPDPDTSPLLAQEIVVDHISQVDSLRLPPGRYWIRVIVKEGADLFFERVVMTKKA